MPTPNIGPIRAALLEKIGHGVEIDNEKQRLILVGRNLNRPSPRKTRLVKARDVNVRTKGGFLISPTDKNPGRRVAEVVFDSRTDQVVELTERF